MSVVVAVGALGAAAAIAGGLIVVLSPRHPAGGGLPTGYHPRIQDRSDPLPAPAAAKERWTPDMRLADTRGDVAPVAVDMVRPYALLTPAAPEPKPEPDPAPERRRARHRADDVHTNTVPIPTRVPAEEMTC